MSEREIPKDIQEHLDDIDRRIAELDEKASDQGDQGGEK